MAIKPIPSFSSGELDPALHERTTLQKYNSGLKTGRNVVVGKTGRLVSSPGRKWYQRAKLNDRKVLVHAMSHNGCYLEWGHEYVRVYNLETNTMIVDLTHAFTEDDLEYIQFADVDFYKVMIFRVGQQPLLLNLEPSTPEFIHTGNAYFSRSVGPDFVSITETGGSTGYRVEYAVTAVVDGRETYENFSTAFDSVTAFNLPLTSSQKITLVLDYDTSDLRDVLGSGTVMDRVTELRVYRRPYQGGAYGYIGSTSASAIAGLAARFTFEDFGQEADYGNAPPQFIRDEQVYLDGNGMHILDAKTGTVYQQRLVLARGERLLASRTGFYENFTRDYPYSDDSALSFKAGSNGYAEVLRMIDNDGLVVFTSQGVFVSLGALSTENLGLDKKGNWVIDDRVPPIAIPGGVLFVDSLTNSVRELRWSLENGSYIGEELSIFSDHLFKGNRVKSWAFQDGDFPLLWVVFTDGTYASFTYEDEHKMRAWTRHDSGVGVEYVASTKNGGVYLQGSDPELRSKGEVIFVTNVDGIRHIELVIPRYVSADTLEDDPEADMGESIAAMDAVASWKYLINDQLTDDDITVTPVTPGEWSGQLTIACVDDAVFPSPGAGAVGEVLRWFDPDDKSAIDLEVVARASDNSITVQPSTEFPLEYASNPRLYWTKNTFSLDATLSSALSAHVVDDTYSLTPVTPGEWDGPLTLACVDDAMFTIASDRGRVGHQYYFNYNGRIIYLTVTARTNNNSITVQPSEEFPSASATNPALYSTIVINFSLQHLEGEEIAIVGDGHVIASPNNDFDNYVTVLVEDGAVTLPSSRRCAIIHFGRPRVSDIETLDIDTVEQRPVLIESKTVNKVYVRTHQSRGLFVGHRFPEMDKVRGQPESAAQMTPLDTYLVDYDEEEPILGNRYDQPTSRRYEVVLPGDWKSQGRICLRQVDPVHFEILSIIPDLDDQRRINQ